MYKEYFGFSASPFSIAPDPRYLYLSPHHQEAVAHLLYGAQSGGFVMLSGEVGTGKTTLCRYVLSRLPKDTDIALVLNPMLSTNELLATICDELGIAYAVRSSTDKQLIDKINRYLLAAHAQRRNTLLVIDEAQNLSFEVLEQLRLLTNLETDDKKLLRIILVGQPELLDKLAHNRLRQLAQRITARYHLQALSHRELGAYIRYRLDACGVKAQIFTSLAIRALHYRTGGIPRLVNIVCDRALLGAYSADRRTVGARHIMRATREVVPRRRWLRPKIPVWVRASVPAIALGSVLVAVLYWFDGSVHFGFSMGGATPTTANSVPDIVPAQPSDIRGTEQRTVATDSASPKHPLPVAIAPGTGPQNSTDNAVVILFNRWNLNYTETGDGEACLYALRKRLQCLKGRTTVDTLLNYDRPALLHEVHGDDGRYHDVVLVGAQDGMLRVTVGATVQRVPAETFNNYWNGRFTILWKPPDAYTLPLREGDSGPLVTWLANRRAQLEGGAVIASWTLDGDLLNWLKEFQRENHLPVTGVINPETVILIANISNADVPRLNRT